MGSGKTPKNWAHCLAPKINPMGGRPRIFLHRSFSIFRRGIHSLSTAVVEKREVEPEEIYFHRSLAEGVLMEPTAGIEPATC